MHRLNTALSATSTDKPLHRTTRSDSLQRGREQLWKPIIQQNSPTTCAGLSIPWKL